MWVPLAEGQATKWQKKQTKETIVRLWYPHLDLQETTKQTTTRQKHIRAHNRNAGNRTDWRALRWAGIDRIGPTQNTPSAPATCGLTVLPLTPDTTTTHTQIACMP